MKTTMKKILATILTLCILCSLFPAVYAAAENSGLTPEELEVLKITNQEREKEGLAPLTSLPELQKATDTRAVEIEELFSHTRPDGTTCYTVLDEVTLPGYRTAGENISAGYVDPAAAMTGWMNSSGHRANILKSAYVHVGIGHYYQSDSVYRNHWVQLFFTAWSCSYTSMTLSLYEDKTFPMGTPVGDLGIVACLQCKSCGSSYLPVLDSYCTGYDPNVAGVQTVTVSCLGQTATIDVVVEAPTVDEGITIFHTLDLASDITMNYTVKEGQLAGYDSFYMECILPTYEGNVQTGSKTVTLNPRLKDGYYYFTLKELTAVHMNDEVQATIYLQKGNGYYVSPTDHYSIATYAYNQFGKTGATETLKKLGADLLVYGAAAQTFKGYRTDSLADAALTEEQKAYCTDLSTVSFGNTNTVLNDVENPAITWEGKALNLESRVALKFIFNVDNYTGVPEKLTLRIFYRNQDGVYCTNFILGAKDYGKNGWYVFTFDGLLASELRSELSVCIMDGETQLSPTLLYSADTYGSSRTGNLLTLCKALFAYSDSAKAFFVG